MVGQITGLDAPAALTTDASRNLYIGEETGNVLVYAPPYTASPKLVLDDSNDDPYAISVSRQGIVAVANVCSLTPSGQCNINSGSVIFYAKNTTKACATVADPATLGYYNGDAFADNGRLYVTGYLPGSEGYYAVGEIKGGCQAKRITLLAKSGMVAYGTIKINKANQIAIVYYGTSPETLYTYDPPKHGSLGNPVSSTPLVGTTAASFTFLASGSDVYTADYSNSGIGSSSEYDYPVGGMAEKTIAVGGLPVDVAVTPPLVP